MYNGVSKSDHSKTGHLNGCRDPFTSSLQIKVDTEDNLLIPNGFDLYFEFFQNQTFLSGFRMTFEGRTIWRLDSEQLGGK